MAYFAYEDKDYDIGRDTPIYAADCTANDMKRDFYCPNSECRCILHLYAINSNIVRPHFKNIPSSPHIENCWADGGLSHVLIQEKDVANFNLVSFYSLLEDSVFSSSSSPNNVKKIKNATKNPKESSNSDAIKTPRDLYWYCFDHPINSRIGNTTIKNIICCGRTDFFYSRYISGINLIICSYSSYDSNSFTIRFNYPENSSNQTRRFRIDVKFNKDIYQSVLNQFYNSKRSIVILSRWSTLGSIVSGTVSSKAQIFPVPK